MVRQRFLIPSFVGSNPATPAKTDKSLEIATFLLFYKHLYWSVYSVFQNALFLALHGLTFQKILILQCFCLGMSIFHPRERQMYTDSNLMQKGVSTTRLLLLPSRGTYLPSRGHREPYRHIPDIKINATSLMEYFFCKSLYMREPMRVYACSVNH